MVSWISWVLGEYGWSNVIAWSVVDISSLVVGLIHLFSFILKTKLLPLPSVAEEVSQFSLCCVETNLFSKYFLDILRVFSCIEVKLKKAQLCWSSHMWFYLHKGFFVFNRKNRSAKRTETTDSILIEENDQDEEPELLSLVGNVIHYSEEGLQHEGGVEVIPVQHANQGKINMWGGNCCMMILDF